jgi:hypothetical protein
VSSSITGSSITRSAGGGPGNPPSAGGANTGNGGQGKVAGGGGGGAGGSGVVIIAYSQNFDAAVSTTGSPTYSSVSRSGYHVYTFTGSGSITF